jgi:hypothetical protein
MTIFLNLLRKLKFHQNLTRITGTSHEDLCTFIIPRSILLRMRNVSHESCRDDQNTHVMFNNFFRISYHLWDNVKKYSSAINATDDNIIWCMRILCWITYAPPPPTHTHTQNMKYLLLFHGTNGYAKAPQCYVHKYIACLLLSFIHLVQRVDDHVCVIFTVFVLVSLCSRVWLRL